MAAYDPIAAEAEMKARYAQSAPARQAAIDNGRPIIPDFRDQLWGFQAATSRPVQSQNSEQNDAIARQKQQWDQSNAQAQRPGGMQPTYQPAMLDPVRRAGIINQAMRYAQPAIAPNAQDGNHTAGGATSTIVNPQSAQPAVRQQQPLSSAQQADQQAADHLNLSTWDYFMKYGGG